MSESVVYSEVKYKKEPNADTGRVGPQIKGSSSPENEVVYASVVVHKNDNTSHPDPSKDDSTSQQDPPKSAPAKSSPKGSEGTGKRGFLRLAVVMLCILLMGAIIGLSLYWMNTPSETNPATQPSTAQYVTEGNKHTTQRPKGSTTDVKKHTDPQDSSTECQSGKCLQDWERHGNQCYFFSKGRQNWTSSRDECERMHSHLAIINDKEEQRFLMQKIANVQTNAEDKFWIGLNDRQTEGKWQWVDGTPLSDDKIFWLNDQEPDDWKGKNNEYPDGEDCVRMGELKVDDHTPEGWVDTACERPFNFICETKVCQ